MEYSGLYYLLAKLDAMIKKYQLNSVSPDNLVVISTEHKIRGVVGETGIYGLCRKNLTILTEQFLMLPEK